MGVILHGVLSHDVLRLADSCLACAQAAFSCCDVLLRAPCVVESLSQMVLCLKGRSPHRLANSLGEMERRESWYHFGAVSALGQSMLSAVGPRPCWLSWCAVASHLSSSCSNASKFYCRCPGCVWADGEHILSCAWGMSTLLVAAAQVLRARLPTGDGLLIPLSGSSLTSPS